MNIYITGHIGADLDSVSATISYAEFLKKTERYPGANIVPVIPNEPNLETMYVLNKYDIATPKTIEEIEIDSDDAFILVDHNEESQRHPKIVNEQIIEIVDHHKINISFTSPIRLDVKPLGSTSSLIYEQFEIYGVKPSAKCSSLILSAILSDTQGLKSSTTTGYDSEIAHKLSKELDISLDKLTFEIFRAKSDITGLNAEDIVTKDYKIFDFGGKRILINQIETVEPKVIFDMTNILVDKMNNLKTKEGVSMTFTVVTDILNVNSHVIYTNNEEKSILEKAFTTNGSDYLADIGPKMSRKKDIAPEIEKAILS